MPLTLSSSLPEEDVEEEGGIIDAIRRDLHRSRQRREGERKREGHSDMSCDAYHIIFERDAENRYIQTNTYLYKEKADRIIGTGEN